jgi:hypothetical protein
MKYFFDSSAFAKRYILEKDSPLVVSKCKEASEIVISAVCVVEVVSALSRLLREKMIDRLSHAEIKRSMMEEVSRVSVVAVNEDVINRATQVVEAHAVRSLDAIHLSSALLTRPDLFISGDKRQCEAARKLGLKVLQL